MLDWKGGMDYGLDYGIYIFHSSTQLYCVVICLLTYSLPAPSCIGLHSCSLLEVVGVKGNLHI